MRLLHRMRNAQCSKPQDNPCFQSGASHTPGTFLGFFFLEAAGVLISIVMLRGGIFSKINAYAGIFGFSIMMVFEYFSSFVTGLSDMVMLLAMFGGILSMVWYILLARKLFQLG